MITVEVVDQNLTRELRRSVLRPELTASDPLPGDGLDSGVHLGAIEDGRVLSTCYVYADPCPWRPGRPAWHLRQMATWPQDRGRGAAGMIVEAAAELCAGQGAELLWCHARASAVPFYRTHGFTPYGALFTDSAHPIEHQRMVRELAPGSAGDRPLEPPPPDPRLPEPSPLEPRLPEPSPLEPPPQAASST